MDPQPEELRIGSTERDDAIRVLGEHFATGRLDVTEYEERAGRAAQARTPSELRTLFTDLPGPYPVGVAFPGPGFSGFQAAPPPSMQPYAAAYPNAQQGISPKSKVVAGILQIVPGFGIGRFYSGQVGIGVAQLLLTFCFGAGALWCLVDGIIILINGGVDEQGRRLRD